MPSPKTSWNKAARRQRKFQCPQCPKSYSTEDDLKSHLQIHAEKTPKHQKPYACSHCDKRFSWKGSLKVHVTKHHAGKPVVGGDDDEDAAESSQDERSSSQEASPDTAIKTKNDATKKLDTPKNPATGSQEPPPKSFESVVNNLLSSGLVSNSSQSPAEKSTLPRRKRSSADAKEVMNVCTHFFSLLYDKLLVHRVPILYMHCIFLLRCRPPGLLPRKTVN